MLTGPMFAEKLLISRALYEHASAKHVDLIVKND